jgi:hypothetical protein
MEVWNCTFKQTLTKYNRRKEMQSGEKHGNMLNVINVEPFQNCHKHENKCGN